MAEYHQTAYKCFDGTYFEEKNGELANRLKNSYVFHVSLGNGTGLGTNDRDPWRAIGSRMLLQLLRKDGIGSMVESVNFVWYPPTPTDVIDLLETGGPSKELEKKTIFLIVDVVDFMGSAN